MEKVLPKGWVETTIKELLQVKSGDSLSAKNRVEGDIPVYGGNGITGYHNNYNREEKTIVIGRVGYYCGSVHIAPPKSWVTDNAFVVLFYENCIDFRFLERLLSYTDLRINVSSTAQPVISGGKIYPIRVVLPPKAEQERIVAKLDSLFAHLEQVKQRMERVPLLLKNFRQAVLTQAVTGKLTEEWRVGKELGKTKLPFKIPNEWKADLLSSVSKSLKYGSSSKSNNLGDVPVLRMGNLQNGELDWSDLKFSSDKDEISKYIIKKGDILFNRTNSPDLVGKTSIFRGNREAIYAGYLIKIDVDESVNPYFVNYVLNTNYAKAWCREVKTDGVSQSNINAKKLGAFVLPIPSLEEQTEIVRRIESLFAKADKIEASYAKLKAQIDQLPQALLAKAFRGELVEQLPTDGDARDLLKEIAALKAAAAPKKKAKPRKKVAKRVDVAAEPEGEYGKK